MKYVLSDFTDRTSPEYKYVAGLDCFIRWGICFSQYAERVLEQLENQTTIKRLREERAQMTGESDLILNLTQKNEEMGLEQLYGTLIEKLRTRQRDFYERMIQRDCEQAMDYQKRLANFEKIYFKRYIEMSED